MTYRAESSFLLELVLSFEDDPLRQARMNFSRFFFLLPVVFLGLIGCERHSWEDVKDENGEIVRKGTKRLFEEHHGDDSDHAKHGDDHKKDKEHKDDKH